VNEYQVIGPKRLDSERFEVTAELPEGKTRTQVNLMLQNLLAERFGLAMHRELKEMEIYELRRPVRQRDCRADELPERDPISSE
jgi:uncharacterized protein (TIGR03435 family)